MPLRDAAPLLWSCGPDPPARAHPVFLLPPPPPPFPFGLPCISLQCGGALIGRDKILTAAHCYDQTSISSAVGDVVRIGGLTLGEGIQRPVRGRAEGRRFY